MSATNGDSARFHVQRKTRILRRQRSRDARVAMQVAARPARPEMDPAQPGDAPSTALAVVATTTVAVTT